MYIHKILNIIGNGLNGTYSYSYHHIFPTIEQHHLTKLSKDNDRVSAHYSNISKFSNSNNYVKYSILFI